MSRLIETKRAYDRITRALDRELTKRSSDASDIEKFRETLDIAFYLLGWAQFEYLVRQESKEIVESNARTKTVDRYAWQHLQDGLKEYSVRKRMDLIFHANPEIRRSLDKDYTVRNDAAHNYKVIPSDAKDVSIWLQKLQTLVDKFEH
jgi:hypothetical protein